jgi:phosphopantothenoylcysteine decarboxylase/phosphopantothenate--cysteine ligase
MVKVTSSAELCENVLKNGPVSDIVIQAAAPADFTPAHVADKKIKKQPGEGMTIELKPTTDIAAELGRRKHEGQVLVAFAAETNDVTENARKKLVRKNADMIVANDVTAEGAGFGVDTNIVTLITQDDLKPLPKLTKRQVGDCILDEALRLLEQKK